MKQETIRLLLLLTAIALICSGIAQGDSRDVLMKACRICMECVGIG